MFVVDGRAVLRILNVSRLVCQNGKKYFLF